MPDLDATAKRRKFRELLARPSLLVMPGGFSPVYARAAELAGFESFFVAGSQMSGFLAGVPDTGIIGLRDIVDHARHVAAHTTIPILLDADTGFGNAVNVHYAVQEIVRTGVAGVQLEDQEAPKKSPTGGGGRRVIPIDEAVGKIKSAVAARDAIDPSFVICARVDSIGAEGTSFEETIARCKAYASDARADLIWINAVETRAQLKEVCAQTPAPVLCNWWSTVEPKPKLDEFQQLGARVALYPTFVAQTGLQAAWHVLNDFKQRGDTALADWDRWVKASPYGPADYKGLTGHAQVRALEEEFLPASKQRDYGKKK